MAFRPDGKVLAAAGADGLVRLFNPETGSIVKEFAPVAVKHVSVAQNAPAPTISPKQEEPVETEVLPKGAVLASLDVQPKEIRLSDRFAYIAASGHRQASFRRDDRRDPDDRTVSDCPKSPKCRAMVWCGPGRTARRRCN